MTPRDRAEAMLHAWCEPAPQDQYRDEFIDAVADAIAEAEDAARKDEREACAEATKVASGCCDECDAAIAVIQEAIRTRGGAP